MAVDEGKRWFEGRREKGEGRRERGEGERGEGRGGRKEGGTLKICCKDDVSCIVVLV